MSNYDYIIIGGGHNGLVCASYLSKNKKKVLLIEQKEILGGLVKYSDFIIGNLKRKFGGSGSSRAQKQVDNGNVALVNIKTDFKARAQTVKFASYST